MNYRNRLRKAVEIGSNFIIFILSTDERKETITVSDTISD